MEITRRGEHGEHRSIREQHVSGPDASPRSSTPFAPSVPPAHPTASPWPAAPSAAPHGPQPGSRSGTRSGSRAPAPPPADTVTDVVRWAAFSCVLVPAVLLWYGDSLAGAAGTALGLAALTGVCVILLRRCERGAALLAAERRDPSHSGARRRTPQQRGRHGRTGPGAAGSVGAGGHASGAGPRVGPWGGNGTGVHRGGRHSGGNKRVD